MWVHRRGNNYEYVLQKIYKSGVLPNNVDLLFSMENSYVKLQKGQRES